jgi:hypothetical protein
MRVEALTSSNVTPIYVTTGEYGCNGNPALYHAERVLTNDIDIAMVVTPVVADAVKVPMLKLVHAMKDHAATGTGLVGPAAVSLQLVLANVYDSTTIPAPVSLNGRMRHNPEHVKVR